MQIGIFVCVCVAEQFFIPLTLLVAVNSLGRVSLLPPGYTWRIPNWNWPSALWQPGPSRLLQAQQLRAERAPGLLGGFVTN